MKPIRIILFAGWILLLAGLALIGVAYVPLGSLSRAFVSNAEMTDLPESLSVEQHWNKTLRTGQKGQVTLSLAPIQSQQVDAAEWRGSWVVESRLELAGFAVDPHGLVSEPLRPGQDLQFNWQIIPLSSSVAEGTLWVYAVHVNASGQTERDLLLASPIAIQAISIGGIALIWVRLIAWIAAFLGFILVLCSFLGGARSNRI